MPHSGVIKNLRIFYDHLIANHKPPKVALVAVMRKLLGFMNAILKNNSFWNDNYVITWFFVDSYYGRCCGQSGLEVLREINSDVSFLMFPSEI